MTSTPSGPNLKGSAADAAQKFLEEAMNDAKADKTKYERKSNVRYYIAVVLKGIALFGGLAVATLKGNQVVLGIIISVAVAIDQLFSNHKRMMTETAAADAIDRTIRKVENNYNDQVLDVINANEANDSAKARTLLIDLARMSAKTMRDELDRVKIAVANANLEFLSSLNLDQPAKTALPEAATTPAPGRKPR